MFGVGFGGPYSIGRNMTIRQPLGFEVLIGSRGSSNYSRGFDRFSSVSTGDFFPRRARASCCTTMLFHTMLCNTVIYHDITYYTIF